MPEMPDTVTTNGLEGINLSAIEFSRGVRLPNVELIFETCSSQNDDNLGANGNASFETSREVPTNLAIVQGDVRVIVGIPTNIQDTQALYAYIQYIQEELRKKWHVFQPSMRSPREQLSKKIVNFFRRGYNSVLSSAQRVIDAQSPHMWRSAVM